MTREEARHWLTKRLAYEAWLATQHGRQRVEPRPAQECEEAGVDVPACAERLAQPLVSSSRA